MKTTTIRIQKFSRPGVILLATVVAIITSVVVGNATQKITTPNAAFISYSLAAGANSAAITSVTGRFENERRCPNPYAREQSVGARGFRHWLATCNCRGRSAAARPPRARGRNASRATRRLVLYTRPADHAARTCAS